MRSAVVLVALATFAAACGNGAPSGPPMASTALSPESAARESSPAVTDAPTTAPSSTTTLDPTTTTTASERPSTTSVVFTGEVATIESELGRVSYTLPVGSFADPRPETPSPDFVVGSALWIVPDCCNLVVTLQNLEPPMPDREMTDRFEANGIRWNLYDSGPRNGTLIMARGTAGPITVLVAAQGPLGDPAGPSTLTVIAAVVRSVIVDPINTA